MSCNTGGPERGNSGKMGKTKFLLEHLKIFLNCASNFENYQSIPVIGEMGTKVGQVTTIVLLSKCLLIKNVKR